MHSRIRVVALPSEIGDFAEDLRRLSTELGGRLGTDALTGDCSPAIDVYETDDSVEISVDLPGVDPAAVRVVIKREDVLIVGEKAARGGLCDATFHLFERDFGRFARTVRLGRPCDGGRARATLADGELRLSVPKVADRRGRSIPVPIQTAASARPTH
jgi:HSP20 family protein